jgi:ERF superfamily
MLFSDEIDELATALSKAQGEIFDAGKGSENPYFKSKYADLAAVRSVIRVPLAKHGLSIVQNPATVQGGVEVQTFLLHSSGQYMSSKLFMPVAKNDAHGIGSAITYARRYSLMSILCLATEDDDGNAAVRGGGNVSQNVSLVPSDGVKESAMIVAINNLQEAATGGSSSLTEVWNKLPQSVRSNIPAEELAKIKKTASEATKATKG